MIAADRVCPYPGCGKTIDSQVFACQPHWFSLPPPVRRRVTSTWYARLADFADREAAESHEDAKRAAIALFTTGTKYPICPGCGHQDHAAFELGLVQGETQPTQCEACGHGYNVSLGVGHFVYTTSALLEAAS